MPTEREVRAAMEVFWVQGVLRGAFNLDEYRATLATQIRELVTRKLGFPWMRKSRKDFEEALYDTVNDALEAANKVSREREQIAHNVEPRFAIERSQNGRTYFISSDHPDFPGVIGFSSERLAKAEIERLVQTWLLSNLARHLPKTAISFSAIFARFEYALKRSGYILDKGQRVEADWDRFANELGVTFWDEVRNSGDAGILIARPPRKQAVAEDGGLDWREAQPVGNVQELLGAVRRVRNNLFHGDKYLGPDWDSSRNERLVIESRAVLELALKKCPMVLKYIEVR